MNILKRALSLAHGSQKSKFSSRDCSFSQEGEDRLISRMLELIGISPKRHKGFFVDVGAHHPTRLSNTYYWHLKGWRGINIDARPGVKKLFDESRPHDVNLELGIAQTDGELRYSMFKEPALNTFDPVVANQRLMDPRCKLLDTVSVRTRPLASVMNEYLPPRTEIDFMSVDVEGLDLEVLQSNDWDLYRPRIILAESCDQIGLSSAEQSDLSQYLQSKGYTVTSKLVHTIGFIRNDQLVHRFAA